MLRWTAGEVLHPRAWRDSAKEQPEPWVGDGELRTAGETPSGGRAVLSGSGSAWGSHEWLKKNKNEASFGRGESKGVR